ncbi:MAG: flagellar basal body-associated protein FliL [Helicobacter sp.]|nr:flagellar basal body-associated protein FliL [Helicobacter sp.]MBD5168452.1 flagellar basal body-associated protein FliL [Helicobacter sp.]MDE5817536.1 flagellar basal body-associated protein FliL [Helicobacter sp.]MDE6044671.1 flagellar basal body-associated protein FliL [Helicobacter sp.]MDE7195538.1 flagellar basal body-associated protein FliL [Helicobacter sp.]
MADEKNDAGGGGGGGGNKMLIIIIAAVVGLLLIIGVVVAILLMSGGDEPPPQAAGGAPAASGGNPALNMRSGGQTYLSIGPTYAFDQIIVNLASQSGRRYLKTTINAELSSDNLMVELDTKKPAIRDTMISVLSSKTFEEISTAKGKENLKNELVERINESLVDGKIVNLFFTDFAIQ